MSTDTSLNSLPSGRAEERASGGAPIIIDGISYIPSSVLLTGTPKVSFKHNRSFAVVDTQGQATRLLAGSSELGFFYNDTRYLAIWEMTFNGVAPISLANELRFNGNTMIFSMTNPDLERVDGKGRIVRDSLLIRRVLTLIEDTLYETVEIRNFKSEPIVLQLEQWAGGSFDDVFEVRGYPRIRRGRVLAPLEPLPGESVLQYEGLDGIVRKTYIRRLYESEKIRESPSLIGRFTRVEVPPQEEILLKTVVSFDRDVGDRDVGDRDGEPLLLGVPYRGLSIAEEMKILAQQAGSGPFGRVRIESDNAIFNRSIVNAELDIRMLLGNEAPAGSSQALLYPYAGVPWFSAPFGRDGMITAYQLLPWYPDIARGVLEFAFGLLGSKEDAFTDEQPGKVFHEMRRGEMARTREVPFIPYYGSVDSTPLALVLLYEYVRWTLDLEFLRKWWPRALQALGWIETWGDRNGDGFVEYAKQSPSGLVNQGWKDSHDSIMHADGTLANAPISLCEVQGYCYRARMSMSGLAYLLHDASLGQRLRLEALQLKARFKERFWDEEDRYIYLALDGRGAPCKVKSSNMGHCLWSQILSASEAASVARHLVSDELFSGFGVRTLASGQKAYNPLSYHNGSVWPHDNSLIMEGLRLYGLTRELETVASGLLDVLEGSVDFRLPELFCGFRKHDSAPPVPYEVACKPQAWAAGSVFLMLKSLLGIAMDVDQNYVVFNAPILPRKINTLEIHGLRGRDWELDLLFLRNSSGTTVKVTRKEGGVRILTVK